MPFKTDEYTKNSSSDNPTHSCVIHEVYDYDWSKLMICSIIDNIIDTSTSKISFDMVIQNFSLSENIILQHDLSVQWSVYMTDND